MLYNFGEMKSEHSEIKFSAFNRAHTMSCAIEGVHGYKFVTFSFFFPSHIQLKMEHELEDLGKILQACTAIRQNRKTLEDFPGCMHGPIDSYLNGRGKHHNFRDMQRYRERKRQEKNAETNPACNFISFFPR